MAYSGKYKVKNVEKYDGDYTKVTYRSHWEKLCMMWCDSNTQVAKWSSEETVIPYYYDVDKKYHRYFMDLKIKYKDGTTILVEIKPKKETEAPNKVGKTKQRYLNEALTYVKNQNKWKAAFTYAKDRSWSFEIWTEDTLKGMGIMKEIKTAKKLKPLKPYKNHYK